MVANKKLIEDLQTIECNCGDLWIQDVAGRALEEIEYLENELACARELNSMMCVKKSDFED